MYEKQYKRSSLKFFKFSETTLLPKSKSKQKLPRKKQSVHISRKYYCWWNHTRLPRSGQSPSYSTAFLYSTCKNFKRQNVIFPLASKLLDDRATFYLFDSSTDLNIRKYLIYIYWDKPIIFMQLIKIS
jgi:hypothetical protein